MSQTLPTTALPFAKTRTAQNLVFISGQVGIDPKTGKLANQTFEAEAHQVMQNLGLLLREQGLNFSDLVNVTIYLKKMNHYQQTNRVYSSYFTGPLPARVCIAVADLPAKANIEIAATAQTRQVSANAKEVVKAFLTEVRSGKNPEKAALYLAENVLAHQMNAEKETTVTRSPQDYADHVREFLDLYGPFTFEVTELLAEGDKVYARWKQTGHHLTTLDGYAPTGKPLVEIASAVYRVQNGKIVEYWIQIDRLGLEEQLKQGAKE